MASEPSYTNVRMDANSPLGQWWRHQSDRDFSMQVLVQLANQKFGHNVDLKAYSLKQMINGNSEPLINHPADLTKQANTDENNPVASHEPDEIRQKDHQPKAEPVVNKQQIAVKPPAAQDKTSESENDQELIADALFGDSQAANKPKPHKKGQSFRDQL